MELNTLTSTSNPTNSFEVTERKRKSRRERFLDVAEKRTVAVLKRLRLLGNCANKAAYEYTDEDIQRIFGAVEAELEEAKAKFRGRKDVEFRLRDSEERGNN